MNVFLFFKISKDQRLTLLFCQRAVFCILILFTITKQSFAQYSYVVSVKEANIRDGASAKSSIIGKVYDGDTISLRYATGSWYEIELNNGRTGFIYKTNLRRVALPVYQTVIKPVENFDLSKWNFNFLFTKTIEYFLLITGIVVLVVLIIYYLK